MKILYFDYWLKGIKHFEVLDKEFKARGIETQLLHLSSWVEDVGSIDEMIQNIRCTDISYYGNKKLLQIIGDIKPDIVLGLNMYYVTDRTVSLSCAYHGIPYVYLSHGKLTTPEKVDEGKKFSKKLYRRHLWSRIRKNFVHVFPEYIYASEKVNKSFFPSLWRIFNVLWNPSENIIFSRYGKDLVASLCMVYSHSDKHFLVRDRCFPEELVQVVGNPEMDYIVDEKYEDLYEDTKTLLYLEDGSVQIGVLTKEQWYDFIDDLIALAKEKLYKVIIKLHPRTDMSEHLEYFEKNKDNIVVYQNEIPLLKLVAMSSVCVSFYSSTLLFALLLNKKILSPRWGRYKQMLKLYPDEVINYVYKKEDFWLMPNKNSQVIEEFLANEVGFTGEKAVPKIVESVLKIANEVR